MFRFSIRELFLVTLVAAMGLAWGIDRCSLAAQADAHRKAAEEAVDEARLVAHLTAPGAILCGNEAGFLMHVRRKYGAPTSSRFEVLEEDKNSN